MARVSRVLLLAATGAALVGGEDTKDLEQRLNELHRELNADGKRLEEVGRRLQVQRGSIFGTPRVYTDQEKLSGASKHCWLLICAAMAMFVNAGLAMLKAGCSRVKFVQHTFLLALWDLALSSMTWWVLGYSFALSGPYPNKKMWGYERFAGHLFLEERSIDGQVEPTERIVAWFFSWAMCSVSTSIVSGGLAERNFVGYSIHVLLNTCIVFPIVMAWTWGRGWLFGMETPGYQDWAGSGVIHFTGGLAALAGVILAGPRPGRFDDMDTKARVSEIPEHFIPHSQPLIVFGTFVAWFGWFGLNCGFTFGIDTVERGMIAAHVCMNMTIAACFGGLTAFGVSFVIKKRKNDLPALCLGILSGLVAISAGAASVECGSALFIGMVAGCLYPAVSAAMKVRKLDDPTDAFAVHGVNGAWGLIALSLLDWGTGFDVVHGTNGFFCIGAPTGGCFKDGAGGNLAAAIWAALAAIIAWTGGLSVIIFCVLKGCRCLQHKPEVESDGVDRAQHIPNKAYSFGVLSSTSLSLNSI